MSVYDTTSVMVSDDNEYYWITIPDHILEKLEWWIDDNILCEVVDGKLILTNISKNERNEDNNE